MYENFAQNELKNNLFEYATSELSQDAFICWLASYAHEEAEKDEALNECARKMLEMFVPDFKGKNFKLLNVERQVDNVDVLLTVDCEGVIYKIIVEDKTYTSDHDNQLERYKKNLEDQHKADNFIIKGVYYKTGFQSDLSSVEKSKYKVIKREKMLGLMKPYAEKTNNQIFISYYNYWNSKQKLVVTFKTLPVVDWSWWAVYGFYDYLKEELGDSNLWLWYGYVANPSGGFHAMSISVQKDEDKIYIDDDLNIITDKEIIEKYNSNNKDKRAEAAEKIKYKYSFYFHIRTTMNSSKVNTVIADWKIEIYLEEGLSKEERRKEYKEARDKFRQLLAFKNIQLEKVSRIGNGKCVTLGSINFNKNENYEVLKDEILKIVESYKEILAKLKN